MALHRTGCPPPCARAANRPKHIKSHDISWKSQEGSGHYKRDSQTINEWTREISIAGDDQPERNYIIFEHSITWPDEEGVDKRHRPVQIAFGLDKRLKYGGAISKITKSQLFVFFPTTKETHVGFILQGPYRTNPSRENVFPDDDFNKHLINETSKLLVESLEILKELKLLSLVVLSALPLNQENFEEGNLFRPLYTDVRDALQNKPLFPKHQGGFIAAIDGRLARGAKLADVFSATQLGKLYDKDELHWLDVSITADKHPELHAYLVDLVKGIQITSENLSDKLAADFFGEQSLDWLINFIIFYIDQGGKAFKNCPFIRLESGEQVPLPQDSDLNAQSSRSTYSATAWFAPRNFQVDEVQSFPLVHPTLAKNEEVRKFLERQGIAEIRRVHILEKSIFQKYQERPLNDDISFNEYKEAYRKDLRLIGQAYADANDEEKAQISRTLNDICWLACIDGSGNASDKVFWKAPQSEFLYTKTSEELGLTVPEDKPAYFLHPFVFEALDELKSIKEYLNDSIKALDTLAIVKDFILLKYSQAPKFDEANYRKDLQWICEAFSKNDSEKKELKAILEHTRYCYPPVAWLACVHASGKHPGEIFWRKPKAVDLFAKPVEEQAFRVPEDMEGYFLHPSVCDELGKNESAQQYLESCVNKMDARVIVERFILPKYNNQDTSLDFDEDGYRADCQWIGKAYAENRNLIADKLKNIAWLACNHASGNSPEYFWKKPDAARLYKPTEIHRQWFLGIDDVEAYFPCLIINSELNSVADDLIDSIGTDQLVKKQVPIYAGYVYIENRHGSHKRGLDSFDPNWEIIGITQILKKPTLGQSKILWTLLLDNSKCIRGFIESSRYSNWSDIKKTEGYSKIGELLSTSKWLPDRLGILHKPGELLLVNLPDEFDTRSAFAIDVADKLGMKKPELEQALDIVVGDDNGLKRIIDAYKSGSDADRQKMLKIIPQEISPQPVPPFKESIKSMMKPQCGTISHASAEIQSYSITNPNRYQDNANQDVTDAVRQYENTLQSIRFSPVRERPSNQEARNFLYEQYQGHCQITGNTFRKASANADGEAENYFEACSLVSNLDADYLNDAGNMLCLSADTMAKLKNANREFLDTIEEKIEPFKNRKTGEVETVKVRIILAGEEQEITWSERHFSRLVALWDKT